jgi:restriction system protein
MAEITRQRVGELVRKVFQILKGNPDGLPAKTVLEQLEKIIPPTDFEKSDYPNRPGVRRFEKIVRFSTIGPVKAGWLIKNKGQWSLTEEGERALASFPDPEEFAKEAARLYRQWKQDQPDSEEGADEDSPDTATTVEEAEEAAWGEIQNYLSEMNPFDFQDLVAGLLRGMGYHVSWVAPPGPDKGVDIVAHVDPLGVQGPRVKVQVKRKADDKVHADTLRSFMATLGESDVGLFVSTGGFTRDAEAEARGQEKRRIMLVDLKRLFDLWVEHYDRIPEPQRRLLTLKPVHYLAPLD